MIDIHLQQCGCGSRKTFKLRELTILHESLDVGGSARLLQGPSRSGTHRVDRRNGEAKQTDPNAEMETCDMVLRGDCPVRDRPEAPI